jgi:hypothetical protein
MKKRYSSPCIKFTVNIKKNGKQFPLTFPMWDNERRRRFIDIDNEQVQKQLESLADFGTYFNLDNDYHDPEEEIPVQVEEVKEPTVNTHEVETLAEAKKYLSELGVKVFPSMNKVKAIVAAGEKGIVLIIKN